MDPSLSYSLAADAILIFHALFVIFVVFGLLLIFIGKWFSWAWVKNPWFRIVHLVAIGIVVIQSWIGVICPLTMWEMSLRAKAGESLYSGSFIAHWLETLLYSQAPAWVFVIGYTAFGVLVIGSWFWVRPRRFTGEGSRN